MENHLMASLLDRYWLMGKVMGLCYQPSGNFSKQLLPSLDGQLRNIPTWHIARLGELYEKWLFPQTPFWMTFFTGQSYLRRRPWISSSANPTLSATIKL